MFTIHRSERADALVAALADVVRAPTDDAFRPEVVAVPTRGVERWLTHRLSAVLGASAGRSDGICANVEFPFPGRLVGDALARATGVDRERDPWRPERLVWPVLDVIDAHGGDQWMQTIGRHVGAVPSGDGHDGLRADRRFSTARHIADLFDRYATYRPDLVLSWLDGVDGDVPYDSRWQPELYRRLADHVGDPSPPARTREACALIERDGIDLQLPPRLSLFGLTRLPASHLAVLRSMAGVRDVHLFALHPSLTWWERIAAIDVDPRGLPRSEDPTTDVARNPLLRTWADDTRELQLVLSEITDETVEHHPVDTSDEKQTLLGRLQADIRCDAAPAGRPRRSADTDGRMAVDSRDDSVQVHACHGRFRQVEILRDAICHLLADDPTLEPRDVIVLCPDIEAYAADLHAVFGAHRRLVLDGADDEELPGRGGADSGVPDLPYRLADRSLRQTNPILGVLAEILDLVDGRLTIRQVLTLAGREPVRRRFGFDDEALRRITSWLEDGAVRWGLDADHRRPWSLHGVDANTWRNGIDRLLLGVAMDDDDARMVGNRLPIDDVDSGAVDLAGRLAEFVDRLASVVQACEGRNSLDDWVSTLGRSVDLLCSASGPDAWQRAQTDRMLQEMVAESGGTRSALSLTEVRALLSHRLEGAPSRTDFRTGAITMCTLVPMRAVPHRVVCVLGLDAESFPRVGAGDGDDLLLRRPLVGDRDPRTEDRQLLLDAVLAATDHLVITYSARDERTNEPRPPAVPLAEFLDVIDDTGRGPGGATAGSIVVRDHPLQPFDPSAFASGSDAADGPWSFDATHLAGARALTGERVDPTPLVAAALPELPETVVSIDSLVRFVQHPAREFLRQRLEVSTWRDDEVLSESIPFELDGLGKWQVGDRLLGRALAGESLDDAAMAEQTLGFLPPNELGFKVLTEVWGTVTAIHATATTLGVADAARSIEVDTVCDGVRVVGAVPGVRGDVVAGVSYSSIKAKDRVANWVRLLALTATRPEIPWEAILVGREKRGAGVVRHRALDSDGRDSVDRADEANALLTRIVDLRRRGLREPLPLPCATGEAWVNAARWRRTPEENAATEWTSGYEFDREDKDAAHVLVHGGVVPFEALLQQSPAADEQGPGWDTEQATRFGRLAHRLWAPILVREVDR